MQVENLCCFLQQAPLKLLVLELDGVGEQHGRDVAGVGAGDGDDGGTRELVEYPVGGGDSRLVPGRVGGGDRRLRLHLDVPVHVSRRQFIRRHRSIDRFEKKKKNEDEKKKTAISNKLFSFHSN